MFGEYDGFGGQEEEGREFHNPQGPRNLRVREIVAFIYFLPYATILVFIYRCGLGACSFLIGRQVRALKLYIAHVVQLLEVISLHSPLGRPF